MLILLDYQIQCLLISVLCLESSYAYPTKNLIDTANTAVINSHGIVAHTIKNTTSHTEPFSFQGSMQRQHEIIRYQDNIAENSQITKSISTNAQGVDSKTYRIKPASASSKVHEQHQINKLNMNTMKWESELNLSPNSGTYNSISNPKLK
jgi:hypothetical protein